MFNKNAIYKALLVSAVILPFSHIASAAVTLKLAYAENSQPVKDALQYIGKAVAEKTNGEVNIQYFPDAQLGGERELVEMTQVGVVDITKVSSGLMESFAPVYGVFSLPYLFTNQEQFYKVMSDQDVMGPVYNSTASMGFTGVGWYDSGARSFYMSKGPINTIADLKGKKIRVMQSETSIKMLLTFTVNYTLEELYVGGYLVSGQAESLLNGNSRTKSEVWIEEGEYVVEVNGFAENFDFARRGGKGVRLRVFAKRLHHHGRRVGRRCAMPSLVLQLLPVGQAEPLCSDALAGLVIKPSQPCCFVPPASEFFFKSHARRETAKNIVIIARALRRLSRLLHRDYVRVAQGHHQVVALQMGGGRQHDVRAPRGCGPARVCNAPDRRFRPTTRSNW